MAEFQNLGFETAGTNPGEAESWTLVTVASVEEIAEYAPSPGSAWEGFEAGWDNDVYEFALASVVLAAYDPVPDDFEDFEAGWDNDVYETEIGITEFAPYDSTPEDFEDFEEGWDNDVYETSIASADFAPYDSAPEDFEDYEEGWGNDAYETSIGSPDFAAYDGASPEDFEDFEETRFPTAFTADPATDVFTSVGHGLSDTNKVFLGNMGGLLPDGLSPDFPYYVIAAAADTFQLSQVSGGAAIDIADYGTGTHYWRGDPALYWTERMATY